VIGSAGGRRVAPTFLPRRRVKLSPNTVGKCLRGVIIAAVVCSPRFIATRRPSCLHSNRLTAAVIELVGVVRLDRRGRGVLKTSDKTDAAAI